MKRMYTWAVNAVRRNLTVADIRAHKGRTMLTQVLVNSAQEAAAAGIAGIDLIIAAAANVENVRAGNNELFLTAGLGVVEFPTESDLLRAAFRALEQGADAVMTARSFAVVSMLAREDIPVIRADFCSD